MLRIRDFFRASFFSLKRPLASPLDLFAYWILCNLARQNWKKAQQRIFFCSLHNVSFVFIQPFRRHPSPTTGKRKKTDFWCFRSFSDLYMPQKRRNTTLCEILRRFLATFLRALLRHRLHCLLCQSFAQNMLQKRRKISRSVVFAAFLRRG